MRNWVKKGVKEKRMKKEKKIIEKEIKERETLFLKMEDKNLIEKSIEKESRKGNIWGEQK